MSDSPLQGTHNCANCGGKGGYSVIELGERAVSSLGAAMFMVLPVYTWLAMRRVYGGRCCSAPAFFNR